MATWTCILTSQNLKTYAFCFVMHPLKSSLKFKIFKFKHFFAKALVNVLNPSMIGSTTTTTCNASSFSITCVIEKCDVLGKDHLPFFMDLGPSC